MVELLLKQYLWLIDTLKRNGEMTFDEIAEQWEESSLNDNGSVLTKRTIISRLILKPIQHVRKVGTPSHITCTLMNPAHMLLASIGGKPSNKLFPTIQPSFPSSNVIG